MFRRAKKRKSSQTGIFRFFPFMPIWEYLPSKMSLCEYFPVCFDLGLNLTCGKTSWWQWETAKPQVSKNSWLKTMHCWSQQWWDARNDNVRSRFLTKYVLYCKICLFVNIIDTECLFENIVVFLDTTNMPLWEYSWNTQKLFSNWLISNFNWKLLIT